MWDKIFHILKTRLSFYHLKSTAPIMGENRYKIKEIRFDRDLGVIGPHSETGDFSSSQYGCL
jgi:hypothetical protein